jgi:hypothetical protein
VCPFYEGSAGLPAKKLNGIEKKGGFGILKIKICSIRRRYV